MGFFGRIFGSTRERPAAVREVLLGIEELPGYLDSQTRERKAGLEKKAFSRLAEIKHLLKQLNSVVREVEARELDLDQGHSKLRKIVSTSKKTALKKMRFLLEKLSPPSATDLAGVRDYAFSSGRLLQSEIEALGKNIAITGIVLKKEVKQLGDSVRELDLAFKELKGLFEDTAVFEVETANNKISELKEALAESREAVARKSELGEELSGLDKEASELKRKMQALDQSGEAKELKVLGSRLELLAREKEEVRSELINLLAPVDKPLRKLRGLVDAKKFFLEEGESAYLRSLALDPMLAMKSDPKAETLKKILAQVEGLVRQGTITLKEKELEKKLSAIKRLRDYDFFSQVFWKLNNVESEAKAVEKQLSASGLGRKKRLLEDELSKLMLKRQETAGAVDEQSAVLENKEQQLSELKKEIERLCSKIVGEKVRLKD